MARKSISARTYDGKRVTFYPYDGTVMYRQKKVGEVPGHFARELADEIVGYYTLAELPCVFRTVKQLARRKTTHAFPPHGEPARARKILWLRDEKAVIAKRCMLNR